MYVEVWYRKVKINARASRRMSKLEWKIALKVEESGVPFLYFVILLYLHHSTHNYSISRTSIQHDSEDAKNGKIRLPISRYGPFILPGGYFDSRP
jgi:hypothetical protein